MMGHLWRHSFIFMQMILMSHQFLLESMLSSHMKRSNTECESTFPPVITSESEADVAFLEHELIELPCLASGNPTPEYRWKKNKMNFDPSYTNGRIRIQPDSGTLVFDDTLKEDEGVYQCYATNQAGTALTIITNLRHAYLDQFTPKRQIQTILHLGSSVTLKCTPPRSYPQPDVYWAIITSDFAVQPLELTDRITMDPEGSLHIANVLPEDQNKKFENYACIVANNKVRQLMYGQLYSISAWTFNPSQSRPTYTNPLSIQWVPPEQQVALLTKQWRVKCIFAGDPTPTVEWNRLGASMSDRAYTESFGMELVIDDVQFEDAGIYECSGINKHSTTPIRHSVQLTVQAAPFWTRKPTSIEAEEGATVTFHCQADGVPSPTNQWSINGIPINRAFSNPRMKINEDSITFYDVKILDSKVIQCNATNTHGYIFTNAYMSVHCTSI